MSAILNQLQDCDFLIVKDPYMRARVYFKSSVMPGGLNNPHGYCGQAFSYSKERLYELEGHDRGIEDGKSFRIVKVVTPSWKVLYRTDIGKALKAHNLPAGGVEEFCSLPEGRLKDYPDLVPGAVQAYKDAFPDEGDC